MSTKESPRAHALRIYGQASEDYRQAHLTWMATVATEAEAVAMATSADYIDRNGSVAGMSKPLVLAAGEAHERFHQWYAKQKAKR